jgi:hypothetical protein
VAGGASGYRHAVDVERFVTEVVKAHQGYVAPKPRSGILPNKQALIDSCGGLQTLARLPCRDGQSTVPVRTHPLVEGGGLHHGYRPDPLQEGSLNAAA